MNLFVTVLDFRMHARVLNRALEFYRLHLWDALRSHAELKTFLEAFPDTKNGNTQAALSLWGYKYWTRAGLLRKLLRFFEKTGIHDQKTLQEWARKSNYERDFKNHVPGLGFAVYQWLVMRQGVESIKPDTHVKRFVQEILGYEAAETRVVELLCQTAKEMKVKAYELDWRIWESVRSKHGKPGVVKELSGRKR